MEKKKNNKSRSKSKPKEKEIVSSKRRSKSRYSIMKGKLFEKIKRPRTAYAFFIMDEKIKKRADINAEKNGENVRNTLADMWKNMAESAKAEFFKMAEEDIERYHNDCENVDKKKTGKNVKKSSPNDEKSVKKKKSVRKSKRDEKEEKDEKDGEGEEEDEEEDEEEEE